MPRFLAAPVATALLAVAPAAAHDVPFSYLDLHLNDGVIDGVLTMHAIDVAHDLGLASPEPLRDEAIVARYRERLAALVDARLKLIGDGRTFVLTWGEADTVPERQSIRMRFQAPMSPAPGVLGIHAELFPYDPVHQTFVNIYEGGELRHQAIFGGAETTGIYYLGSVRGTFAVVGRFISEGVRHIIVGPDHVLFLVGLLLVGGSLIRLLTIVTAFTVAHSVTLSLAALDVLSPSGRIVEPAIALSIVYVGADNLLVTREGRDVRPWIAFAFGLVHGFGFASVLKELGLPRGALGWSLASFNFGVELGQLAVVVVVASLVATIRRRNARLADRLVIGGSTGVMAAGAYWFIERTFFGGGLT